MIEQGFNNDLLLTERDRRQAFDRFPTLRHILDFPALRKIFQQYDIPSNSAKRWRRYSGLVAIGLGVVALLGISSEPLYSGIGEGRIELLGGMFALCGIASVLFGTIGALSSRLKEQWLYTRLATETIRKFYFDLFVYRTSSMVRSMKDGQARERYLELRLQWWAGFSFGLNDHLPGMLKAILDNERDWSTVDEFEERDAETLNLPVTSEIFQAYRALRFCHQLQFANYKLRDAGLSSSPTQLTLLRRVTFLCILLVFAVHLLIAISLLSDSLLLVRGAISHVLILWACIIALAARALEEGLQPSREIERYGRYRSQVEALLERFDTSRNAQEKLAVMEEMERVVYQELRGFLQVNDEARFVL